MYKANFIGTFYLFIACCAIISFSLSAATPVGMKYTITRAENANNSKNSMALPYLFSSETMGLNVGVGGVIQGVGQEQLVLGATTWAGAESYGVSAGLWNYRPWFANRAFVSIAGMYAYFPDQRAYTNGQLPWPSDTPRPGSSGSSPDDFIQGEGFSNWLDIKVEYVLPIGSAKDDPTAHYHLRNGLLVNGPSKTYWNPLQTGSTVILARQFNRYQSYKAANGNEKDGDLSAVELGIQYDNTDFAPNPSMGSRQYIGYTFEGTIISPENSWDFVELDLSQYLSIGDSQWARQRIFAFNFWTGYSPSWSIAFDDNQSSTLNAPPYNEGATLGGYNRMRGYDVNRFHDKASLYAAAEYRYTLRYNPIKDVSWLQFLNIDWFQLVAFAEAGQVAPSYDIAELTSDMKFDGGFAVRALAAGLVVRFDYALSEEGQYMWFMINQPF
ncbi:BamA/TamA family outer membrane protein [Vibrio rarus]|uniref:BamA/TamA family outer membrane protein n=1 Tax=Vibrio rarus TaxID=413403 RepID=UPI0021C42E42|nr:BamA/TamA family outer membrane protein [Vibrio rarus]